VFFPIVYRWKYAGSLAQSQAPSSDDGYAGLFVAMLLLFAAVAFLATYIPARRAASIDPAVAFKCE
jgi:hypothetical protein